MRRLVIVIAIVAGAIFGVSAALADSPHFVGKTSVSENLSAPSVTISGRFAGLGGTTYTFSGTASNVRFEFTCTNPGGNVVEPHSGTASLGGTTSAAPAGNGNGSFTLTLTPTSPLPTCPNANWTRTFTSISGVATITMSSGATVLDSQTVPF
jgi:hypothetical protein